MSCLYCPGTDLLEINCQKAYRTGGTVYKPSVGTDYWMLDEFNLEQELTGILDGGDLEMTVCLDCYRIQGFELTPEEKKKLVEQHVNRGDNPRQRAREKRNTFEENKKERESRQHLYDQWKQDHNLFVFYDKNNEKSIAAIACLMASLEKCKAKLGVVKLEWSSTAAYKPKIRYNIAATSQCCLTDKNGGDIVRLYLPISFEALVNNLSALGYHREAMEIAP